MYILQSSAIKAGNNLSNNWQYISPLPAKYVDTLVIGRNI